MIKLTSVTIHNYKCIEGDQSFAVEDDVTVLVGMNESGKTTALEAIAKCNYFDDDPKFVFNDTHDYPRSRLKKFRKQESSPDAVTLAYKIDDELAQAIETDMGIELNGREFTWKTRYKGSSIVGLDSLYDCEWREYLAAMLEGCESVDAEDFLEKKTHAEFDEAVGALEELEEAELKQLEMVSSLLPEEAVNWSNPIQYTLWDRFLRPNLPVFMYYDEYYALPSAVSLDELKAGRLSEDASKTAKALTELADINLDTLIGSSDFEDFTAELEATGADISDTLFEYWTTNDSLQIRFAIDKQERSDGRNVRVVDHILNVRVENRKNRVSLPLDKRSKGFNWFFSFLVWFKKLQADTGRSYVLLLDEPGLNLHALAQADLLEFIEDLSSEYQVVYTTHSPFMIDSEHLDRVRTMLELDDGTTAISDSLQEKDPNTLFPLQAALGYSVAQNLFISKKNLVVEGISDLVYLGTVSSELEKRGRNHLSSEITIVPAGGADKIATFVSLMRGSKLAMVCLLDTFADRKAKARLEDLVRGKIIKEKNILYYDVVLEKTAADIEDLFTHEEYLRLYNAAFETNVSVEDVGDDAPILLQLRNLNGGEPFNHYLPARELAKTSASFDYSEETLNHFEALFELINKLL